MVRTVVARDEFLSPESAPSSAHELEFVSESDPDTLAKALMEAEVLVVRRMEVTEALMRSAPRLRLVQQVGIGVDRIDVDAAGRLSIWVANTAGAVTTAVVEHTFLLLLVALRGFVAENQRLRAGEWSSKRVWEALELAGSVIGVVGYGSIGRGIVRRALAFDARVLVFTRTPPADLPEGVQLVQLDRLLRESDAIVLTVPLTNETRGLLSRRELGLMKPSAILVNVARGAVVDEAALVESLEAGTLRAAALDVFTREPLPVESPLRSLPNVVATPHYAGASQASRLRIWRQVIDNLDRLEAGQVPLNLITPRA